MKLVGNEIFCYRIIKNPLKISVFCSWTQSQKLSEATFKISKYFQKFFSWTVYQVTIVDPLIQRYFWVFPKIKVCNQWHTQRLFGHAVICKKVADFTVRLRFKFKLSLLIKGSNLLCKGTAYSFNKEQHLLKRKRTLLALNF